MAPLRVFYGGTFDPLHNGHVAIALAAQAALDCDVWLVPAADPPHRAPTTASAGQRATMVQLAIAGHPGLHLDQRELRRGRPSYSVETLRELRVEFGDAAPLALLIGADSLAELATWREWRSLLEMAHLVVADRRGQGRPDRAPDGLPAAVAQVVDPRWATTPEELHAAPAGLLFALHQPLHPESATRIRQAMAAGQAWQDAVPPAVAGYIASHGLYGVSVDGAGPAAPL
jgi:nicotinate-nucleotide adenylyltransferase